MPHEFGYSALSQLGFLNIMCHIVSGDRGQVFVPKLLKKMRLFCFTPVVSHTRTVTQAQKVKCFSDLLSPYALSVDLHAFHVSSPCVIFIHIILSASLFLASPSA